MRVDLKARSGLFTYVHVRRICVKTAKIFNVYTNIYIFKTLVEQVSSMECNNISGGLETITLCGTQCHKHFS
jgi:hypothetical protein